MQQNPLKQLPAGFCLSELIADMVLLMQAPAQRRHRVLRYTLDHALADFFQAGPEENLRRGLVYLLGHALREAGAGELHLRIEAGDSGDVCFLLQGSRPPVLPALDTDFRQHTEGFCLPLPQAGEAEKEPSGSRDEIERLAGLLRARRVLIAEDMPLSRELLGYLLERAGAVVELAENGREALARAATTDYDLILMDIRMPEMDGLEATRALRDLDNPKRASVMVIGMSADFHSGNQEEYREAGMDGILGKPFRIDRLCRLLEQNAAPEPRVASGEPALLEWKRLILLREQLDVDTYLDFLRDGECAISAALDELAQLEQAGERDQLAQRAHRLAGLAAALGVERLQAGCRRLEENAQGGESVSNLASDYAEARELLRRLAE